MSKMINALASTFKSSISSPFEYSKSVCAYWTTRVFLLHKSWLECWDALTTTTTISLSDNIHPLQVNNVMQSLWQGSEGVKSLSSLTLWWRSLLANERFILTCHLLGTHFLKQKAKRVQIRRAWRWKKPQACVFVHACVS